MAEKATLQNARITSTFLGREDHGVMTACVNLSGDGWGSSFGGFCFDTYDAATKKRHGGGFGIDFISEVLRVVGVEKWEDLVGKPVRCVHTGLGGRVEKIGHIIEEKWFDPRELVEQIATRETGAA